MCSGAQLATLLEHADPTSLGRARLLDVGAGNGEVTSMLARVLKASDVTAVEQSAPLRRALAQKGFKAEEEIEGEGYDVVSLFNVLDRSVRSPYCPHPCTLLGPHPVTTSL